MGLGGLEEWKKREAKSDAHGKGANSEMFMYRGRSGNRVRDCGFLQPATS